MRTHKSVYHCSIYSVINKYIHVCLTYELEYIIYIYYTHIICKCDVYAYIKSIISNCARALASGEYGDYEDYREASSLHGVPLVKYANHVKYWN